MRVWQVEYMSRPDEREHIVQFTDFRIARTLARHMSDKHDGIAAVIALDDMPDGQPGSMATGHIEFLFGEVDEQVGSLEMVMVPK
jgi:hypothetical protein